MKKILLQLGSIAVVMLVATPAVQASGVGAYASYLDSDELGSAWGGGGLLRFGGETLGLDLRGSYISFDSPEFSIIPMEAALFLRLPVGPLGAYGGAGAGYYYIDPKHGSADDNVGAFPFLGLDLPLGAQMQLFGEVRWLYLETDVDAAIKAAENIGKQSVDITGLGVNIGLMLKF